MATTLTKMEYWFMDNITGKTLIEWGLTPGPWFNDAINKANSLSESGWPLASIEEHVRRMQPENMPVIPLHTTPKPYRVFLEPENALEQDNLDKVTSKMDELMRVPTVVSGVVLPDACPTGEMPVGTVIATKDAIHPGFHSPDVCCSMAVSVFKHDMTLSALMNAARAITHFGPGGRNDDRFRMPATVADDFRRNRFLHNLVDLGHTHMGTQGDGNHFLYVGVLRSTGQPTIVTHHGSRGVGANLYKQGMDLAKKHTKIYSPETPDKSSWIDANSEDGQEYWEALQIVRRWTKWNHFRLHNAIEQLVGNPVDDRFWNEHNFVFKRDDGLFYHAKGATPSFQGFSDDDDGRTLIPMNMASPILLTRHEDNPQSLGFAPHGAGRNMSRTQHMKNLSEEFPSDNRGMSVRDKLEIFKRETNNLDIRSFSGAPDLSELPSAYKNADQVVRSIKENKLARIRDYIDPFGSIMAGESVWDRKKKS